MLHSRFVRTSFKTAVALRERRKIQTEIPWIRGFGTGSNAIHTLLVIAVLSWFAPAALCQKIAFKSVHDNVGLEDGNPVIRFAGKHFATLDWKNFRKPIIYPVYGPDQTPMTRSHPMKKGVANEADDHPHHKSIWCGHGLINGVSFWHEEGLIKVDTERPIEVRSDDDDEVTVSFSSNYLDPKDELVCTDKTAITFRQLDEDTKAIDWDVTIMASEGDLLFGDTKEGMMAIRTHPSLRIDKGAKAVNATGVTGKEIWGKKAAWVDYSATIDGKHVGIAIFDHPENLRHPTTWHARAYGLVAANAFGLSHFEGKPKGTGDLKIKKGEHVRFRYRFVFHKGDAKAAKVEQLYSEYRGG